MVVVRTQRRRTSAAALVIALACGCSDSGPGLDPLCNGVDRSVAATSRQPIASDPEHVGTYPATANSGGGYFYDRVLEYRVWFDTDRGDRFRAFAQFETADSWSRENAAGAPVLALVHQVERVLGPKEDGTYVAVRAPCNAEWRVEWLTGAQRGPTSIEQFLANPRPQRTAPDAERR